MNWEGKVAVVTGGTSGIGEAVVRQLCKLNCTVVFVGRRKELGEKIENELNALQKGHVFYYQMDVTAFKMYDQFVQFVSNKFAGIDLLVNNAGKVTYETCDTMTEKVYH